MYCSGEEGDEESEEGEGEYSEGSNGVGEVSVKAKVRNVFTRWSMRYRHCFILD